MKNMNLREEFGFLEEGDGELGLDGRDDGVAEFQQVGGGLGARGLASNSSFANICRLAFPRPKHQPGSHTIPCLGHHSVLCK